MSSVRTTVLRVGTVIGGNGTVRLTGKMAVLASPVELVAVINMGKFERCCDATAGSNVRVKGPGSAPENAGFSKSHLSGRVYVLRPTSGTGPTLGTTVT